MRSSIILAVALLGLAAIATAQTVRVVGLYSDSTCLNEFQDKDMIGQAFRPTEVLLKDSNRNDANFAPLPWTYTFPTTCFAAGGNTAGATGVLGQNAFPFTPRTGTGFTFTSGTGANVIAQTTTLQYGTSACPGTRGDTLPCSAWTFFKFITDRFSFVTNTYAPDSIASTATKDAATYIYGKLRCDRNLQLVFDHFADKDCTTIPTSDTVGTGNTLWRQATAPMGCYKIATLTLNTGSTVVAADAANGVVANQNFPKANEQATQDVYARVRCTAASASSSFSLSPATLAVAFFTILAIFVQRQL